MLAVAGLARSTAPLPERVATAYVSELIYAVHHMEQQNKESVPAKVAETLSEIKVAMESIKIRDDRGLVPWIGGQMDEDRAGQLIDKIVGMDHMLLGEMYD